MSAKELQCCLFVCRSVCLAAKLLQKMPNWISTEQRDLISRIVFLSNHLFSGSALTWTALTLTVQM